jgi:sugar (pentulose or hexulose) kinase
MRGQTTLVEAKNFSPLTRCRRAFAGWWRRRRRFLAAAGRRNGRQSRAIRVVGGGSQNRLLNQLTADTRDHTVITGLVETLALSVIVKIVTQCQSAQ